jgi:hypothetical protein
MIPLWKSAMSPLVIGMRVGIDLGGWSVGGPARVGGADRAMTGYSARPVRACPLLQCRHLARCLHDGQVPAIQNRRTCGVIAPVFETAQAIEEEIHLLATYW